MLCDESKRAWDARFQYTLMNRLVVLNDIDGLLKKITVQIEKLLVFLGAPIPDQRFQPSTDLKHPVDLGEGERYDMDALCQLTTESGIGEVNLRLFLIECLEAVPFIRRIDAVELRMAAVFSIYQKTGRGGCHDQIARNRGEAALTDEKDLVGFMRVQNGILQCSAKLWVVVRGIIMRCCGEIDIFKFHCSASSLGLGIDEFIIA